MPPFSENSNQVSNPILDGDLEQQELDNSGFDLPEIRWAIYDEERKTFRWSSENENDGSYLVLNPENPLGSYGLLKVSEYVPAQIEFPAQPQDSLSESVDEFDLDVRTIDGTNLPQVRWAGYDRERDTFRWSSQGETHDSFVSDRVSYLILRPNPIRPMCTSSFPKGETTVFEVPAQRRPIEVGADAFD